MKLITLTKDENQRVENILSTLNMPVNKENIETTYLFVKTNGGMNRVEEELKRRRLILDLPPQESSLPSSTNFSTRKYKSPPSIPVQKPPPVPPRSKHTFVSSTPNIFVSGTVLIKICLDNCKISQILLN